MTGIILCGGKSSRMGSDKGLIQQVSKPWALIAAEKINELGFNYFLSVNDAQYSDYSILFSADKLIRDDVSINVYGPLLGILSAHLAMPREDLLVLACDMPLIQTTVITQLLSSPRGRTAEAFVFTNDEGYEPLCAIYTSAGLAHIMKSVKENKLSKHSLKYVLGQLSTYSIEVLPEQKKQFRNFNEQADLNDL